MIKAPTSAVIRTSADIRGFRSLKQPFGPSLHALDLGRIMHGRGKRVARVAHRRWFGGMAG